MKYTLSILVENQPGVLSKVVGLFSRRGYNIDSVAVGATEDPTMSCITIVGQGDDYILEQVEKQLNKVIPVIKVRGPKPGGDQPDCGLDEGGSGGRVEKRGNPALCRGARKVRHPL